MSFEISRFKEMKRLKRLKIEYIYIEREREIDFLSCFDRFSLISIDNGLLSISKKKYPVLSALTENYTIFKN